MRPIIYEYPLSLENLKLMTCIIMPRNACVLSAQIQDGNPVVWAIVNRDESIMVYHWFFIIPTGHPIDFTIEKKFLGTIELNNRNLVVDIFDNGESEHNIEIN